MQNISIIIKVLCHNKNISIRKLEQDIGLGNGTIAKWNKSTPSIDALLKVSKYFNVTLDYLVTGMPPAKFQPFEIIKSDDLKIFSEEDLKTLISTNKLSELDKELLEQFHQLTNKNQKFLIDFIKLLIDQQNKYPDT